MSTHPSGGGLLSRPPPANLASRSERWPVLRLVVGKQCWHLRRLQMLSLEMLRQIEVLFSATEDLGVREEEFDGGRPFALRGVCMFALINAKYVGYLVVVTIEGSKLT